MEKLLVAILLLTMASCLKPPDYSEKPLITLDSISTTHVNETTDSIIFYISFADGDGDLGASETDTVPNLIFIDSRKGAVYGYQFPYITPIGNVKDISGQIIYTFPGLTCTPDKTSDTLFFTVYISDRAGNISNEVTTPDIIINCN